MLHTIDFHRGLYGDCDKLPDTKILDEHIFYSENEKPYLHWVSFCKEEMKNRPFHRCNDEFHTFTQFHYLKLPQFITITYEAICLLILLGFTYCLSRFKANHQT